MHKPALRVLQLLIEEPTDEELGVGYEQNLLLYTPVLQYTSTNAFICEVHHQVLLVLLNVSAGQVNLAHPLGFMLDLLGWFGYPLINNVS